MDGKRGGEGFREDPDGFLIRIYLNMNGKRDGGLQRGFCWISN